MHVERPLVDSGELVDALLDLDVLQEIGVRPVLIVEGADASALYEHTRVCEMRSALVEAPIEGRPACPGKSPGNSGASPNSRGGFRPFRLL